MPRHVARLMALMFMLLLAACGPAAGGTGSSGAAAPTAVARPATSTPRPPTAVPAASTNTPRPATPAGGASGAAATAATTRTPVDPGLARAIVAAQADLTRRLGPSALPARVVSAEAVEWSDGSLGCPQPGMMYPQVVTPGYKVVLESGGQQYAYHGDGSGSMRLCETASGAPTAMAPSRGAGGGGGAASGPLANEIALAKADLTQRRPTLKAEEISVVSAEPVEWNDGSLGCPQPGMMYTMALVPGYRIVLETGGQTYDYHGANGRPPRLCESSGGGAVPRGRGAQPGTPPADPTK